MTVDTLATHEQCISMIAAINTIPVVKCATKFIIKGHDAIFNDKYTDFREFTSFEDAHERCRHNEWVEEVPA